MEHLGRRATAQQVREPEDGVERGTNLMAHVGEKSAFGLVCRLRLLLREQHLPGTLFDLLLQMMTITVQFFAHPFLFGDVFLDADEMSDFSILVAQGRNQGKTHLFIAVFGPVDELSLPVLSLQQLGPHCFSGINCRLACPQERRRTAQDLLA